MSFRFYTNAISKASRRIAAAVFFVGLLLIGFGVVIVAFPEVFAWLAAALFFAGGFGCAVTAIKIFLTQRRFDKMSSDEPQDYRKNVQIHSEEYHDI